MLTRSILGVGLLLGIVFAGSLSQAASSDNILPSGNFESWDSSNENPVWKQLSTELGSKNPNLQIVQENGNRFLRCDTAANRLKIGQAVIPLAADWTDLTVSCRLRARHVRVGDNVWQFPRVLFQIRDATGQSQNVGVIEAKTDTDWATRETHFTIPPQSKELTVEIGVFGPAGVFDVDDLVIIPNAEARERANRWAKRPQVEAKPTGASTSLDLTPTWGREPVETPAPGRGTVCLNGLWRFMPILGPRYETPPEAEWGLVQVPGDWSTTWDRPHVVLRNTAWIEYRDGQWQEVNLSELSRAWYARPFIVPGDWAGRTILLDFSRISTDASVFVNGHQAGEIHWPSGQVDVTSLVNIGETNSLRLQVIATAEDKSIAQYMGFDQVSIKTASLGSRGITGDVFLRSRPAGSYVSDVFVQTSTRQKRLTVDVELRNVSKSGRVTIIAKCLDQSGREEQVFQTKATLSASPVQSLKASWDWSNPRLWDVGKPELYTLVISVTGDGIEDAYSQTFGFREMWIEGRNIYLNGTEFRWRPTLFDEGWLSADTAESRMKTLLDMGFNIAELWPFPENERGTWHSRDMILDCADRVGLPLMGNLLHMAEFFNGQDLGADASELAKRYEAAMIPDLQRIRNHPAHVIWDTTGNFFGYVEDQNPRFIGRRDTQVNDANYGRKQAIANQLIAGVKKQDPTRAVLTHSGGYVGDVHTANHYLDLLPLQDREEWLSAWAKDGDMPYCAIEFGTPLDCTMFRSRNGAGEAFRSEPWITEFCASYLGREAYRLETDDYRRAIVDRYRATKGGDNGQLYGSWQHNCSVKSTSPAFQKLESLFIQNTWRSWRTWGLSGGMIPWGINELGWERTNAADGATNLPPFNPGTRGPYLGQILKRGIGPIKTDAYRQLPAGDTLLSVNGPTLAWIAGPRESFTAKDHHVLSGQKLSKSIVLINDQREAVEATYDVEVTLGESTLLKKQDRCHLEVGEIRSIPLEITAPNTSGLKKAGTILLQASLGKTNHRDSFTFDVFPSPTAPKTTEVVLFDPLGKTTDLLKNLNVGTSLWDGRSADQLLIVGREALSEGGKLPGDLDAFVRRGGRALIMVQNPTWYTDAVAFRICPYQSRRVFSVAAAHPVLAGLSDDNLRDWNGQSTLVNPYPDAYEMPQSPHGYPKWGWRWGGRGTVTSVALEKPHRSGWRPLLECEFDLAYSPLMELDYGQGRLILCTLDLEDHALVDPAAAQLTRNILDYAALAPLASRAKDVSYVGDASGAALLDELGVVYKRDGSATADLLIIGKGGSIPANPTGRVLILPGASPSDKVESVPAFHGSLEVPDWPECRGLSASDLRWKADEQALLFKDSSAASGLLMRQGNILASAIDPGAVKADKLGYMRFTRWRMLRATAQLLANLGASFQADSLIFKPLKANTREISLSGKWKAKMLRSQPTVFAWEKRFQADGLLDGDLPLLQADYDDSTWPEVSIPNDVANWGRDWVEKDGVTLLRRKIDVPVEWTSLPLELDIGRVCHQAEVYVNGKSLGMNGDWIRPRRYAVPAGLIKPGVNQIVIRYVRLMAGACSFSGPRSEIRLRRLDKDPRQPSFYCDDYRGIREWADFWLADDPYRYFRW